MKKLYKVSFGNLYTDAFATDESNRLLFASIIGRNADIQAFIANIQLNHMENLTIKDTEADDPRMAHIGNWDDFKSISTDLTKNITKVHVPNFGILEHLFLYDKKMNSLDKATKSSWMITQSEEEMAELLWGNIKELADIPLLDTWEHCLTTKLQENIKTAHKLIGSVVVKNLVFPGEFNEMVSHLIKTYKLTV